MLAATAAIVTATLVSHEIVASSRLTAPVSVVPALIWVIVPLADVCTTSTLPSARFSGVLDPLADATITWAEMWEALDLGNVLGISLQDFEAMAKGWYAFIQNIRETTGEDAVVITEAMKRAYFGENWKDWMWAMGQGGPGGTPDIFNPPGMAGGGIVTSPTMALIGEAGPEAVIPLDKMQSGVTINFTEPVFFDREDMMNAFVDKVYAKIQRAQRLQFGGAYSG